jgi:dolichol-phosphate mannosyltransferase
MRTLIVTPTFNERDNIVSFVESVRQAAPQAKILIVDDNSPDGTGEVADGIARHDPHVSVMHRPRRLGLGTAYLDAFRQGLRQDFDCFFEMDADHSHDPKYLDSFFAALEAGADVVVGSRNIAGGSVEGWGPVRHFVSKGGSYYSRMILQAPVHDMTTGFKAFTRRALSCIDLDAVHSNGYSFQIEMTYRALRAGLKVVEVPIVFVDRRAGQSKMSRRIFAEAVGIVWRLRLDALLGRV